MTDIERIVWGALGGLAIYVIGQLLSKFAIEPIYELRKSMGEVRFNLAFHGPTIHTPIGRSKESSDAARDALLRNSSDLFAKLHAVPFYAVMRLPFSCVLPGRKSVEHAAVLLRGLSTYVHQEGEKADASLEDIRERVTKIESLLLMEPLD